MIATVVGIVGALLGGFLAQELFDAKPLDEFFDISTWLTAIVAPSSSSSWRSWSPIAATSESDIRFDRPPPVCHQTGGSAGLSFGSLTE